MKAPSPEAVSGREGLCAVTGVRESYCGHEVTAMASVKPLARRASERFDGIFVRVAVVADAVGGAGGDGVVLGPGLAVERFFGAPAAEGADFPAVVRIPPAQLGAVGRVEDAIRFIKQSYRLEDIRLLDYTRLKNMMAVVLAAAFFTAVWLGESVRRGILVRNITRVSKRLFGVPDFHYYALADGIARLFSRCGRWCRQKTTRGTVDMQQEMPLFASG